MKQVYTLFGCREGDEYERPLITFTDEQVAESLCKDLNNYARQRSITKYSDSAWRDLWLFKDWRFYYSFEVRETYLCE